jgi:hypothetical protein
MADPLERGIAALRAGDKSKARHLLSRAVQQAPRSEKAWLWLSGAMDTDEERLNCLKRVLSINPANEAAQRGVAELQKHMATGKESGWPVPATQGQAAPGGAVMQARRGARRQLQVKGDEEMANCSSCGAEIPAGREVVLQPKKKGEAPQVICPKCADEQERAYAEETTSPKLIGGLLAGLAAAVAASAAWFGVVALTKCQIGYVAVGVGIAVGLAVVAGAGGKRGLPLQIMSVVITLIAMAFSEYLIVRYFLIVELGFEGMGFPLIQPVGVMLEYIGAGIESDPVTLLFWGIALLAAFTAPAKRKLRRL